MKTRNQSWIAALTFGVALALGGCGGEAILDDPEYDDETELSTGDEYGYEDPLVDDDDEGPIDEEGPIVETVEEVDGDEWDG